MKFEFEATGRLASGGNFIIFQTHWAHMKYASASIPTTELPKNLRHKKARVTVEIVE